MEETKEYVIDNIKRLMPNIKEKEELIIIMSSLYDLAYTTWQLDKINNLQK